MQELLMAAQAASGPPYLEVEAKARRRLAASPAQAATLERLTADADVETALMSRVILDWGGSRGREYDQALAFLDGVGAATARTPAGNPSPSVVESYLTEQFGDHVTRLLALRFLKEPTWAYWKAAGVALYLQRHRDPATTAALLRFAVETPDERRRRFALEAARAINDPAFASKLGYEVHRARRLERTVPQAVLDAPERAP